MKRDLLQPVEFGIEEKEPLSLNIHGYEIQELIGGGGMGEVYRAVLTARGRVVAMKVVSGRLTRDPEVTARFEAEVAALSQLDHPNVVQVLDHGETVNGRHFLVMEYVEGCDLRRLLRAQRLDLDRAIDIFLKVCAGVSHAHENEFVHRDIKPANILIGGDGTVKVADFGLAKTLEEDSDSYSFTQTRDTFGTPYYVAPEVTRSAGNADKRADIYALGVLLYELLTGSVPMGQFTLLSKKTGLNKKIDSIVRHALADDPQRRLASVEEMANGVRKIAEDHQRGRQKKASRRRALTAVSILVMMGLGVVVGAWMSDGSLYGFHPFRSFKNARHARGEKPWTNSLGMKFVPVGDIGVLFCVNETRLKDYAAFAKGADEELPDWRKTFLTEGEETVSLTRTQHTSWSQPGFPQTPDHPVCGISLLEARFFCAWLTSKELAAGWINKGQSYRLPTDEEWSLAAGIVDDVGPYVREGLPREPSVLPTGNFAGSEAHQYEFWPAQFPADAPDDPYICTAPVGSFPPNSFGLYDMHGNVAEWTRTRLKDRPGFPINLYPLRGGSWATGRMINMMPEARQLARPTRAQPNFGFRIVLDLDVNPQSPPPLDPLVELDN